MTDQEVSAIIKEFRVPLHVRRHCATVANFALELGKKLIAAGEKIDLDLLRHAAIIHDFMRVVDFRLFEPEKFPDRASSEDIAFWQNLRKTYAGRGHEEVGAEILTAAGHKAVANLVQKHRFLQILDGFKTWEEKLLYYADKRVSHDRLVPLNERLHDGKLRNAPETIGTKEAEAIDKKVFDLEQEIFNRIAMTR